MRLAATPPASKPCGWRLGRALLGASSPVSQPSGSSHPSNRAKMPRPTSARASVHKTTDRRSINLLPVGGASRPAPSNNRRNALLTGSSLIIPPIYGSGARVDKQILTLRNPVGVVWSQWLRHWHLTGKPRALRTGAAVAPPPTGGLRRRCERWRAVAGLSHQNPAASDTAYTAAAGRTGKEADPASAG